MPPAEKPSSPVVKNPERTCFYYKKPDHIIADCPVLREKYTFIKSVDLLAALPLPELHIESEKQTYCSPTDYTPFLMDCSVLIPDLARP